MKKEANKQKVVKKKQADELEIGDVIITISVAGKPDNPNEVGVEVKFHTETLPVGTFLDLGQYFTNIAKNQLVRLLPQNEIEAQKNGGG